MEVTLVGIGMGTTLSLTREAADAIRGADLIFGAARMLETARELIGPRDEDMAPRLVEAIAPRAIAEGIDGSDATHVCVLCSGDVGFFSLARPLTGAIRGIDPDATIDLIPGITTVQYLAARLGRPWQDCRLGSAHGRDCDVIGTIIADEEVFLLTGGDETPMTIIERLVSTGLCDVEVTIGQRLSYPDELIVTGTADELVGETFDSLSAVWLRRGAIREDEVAPFCGFPGIPDEMFIRGKAPMTKSEVRALITSHLRVAPGEVFYDVGAGTGSVSVEVACMEPFAHVYAIEANDEAAELIEDNRVRFGAYNVQVVGGRAPQAFEGLPVPDVVFIGGSTGGMESMIDSLLTCNPSVRIMASAVTLETIAGSTELFEAACHDGRMRDLEVIQVAVTRARAAGRYHLMTPESPIFLFQAVGTGTAEETHGIDTSAGTHGIDTPAGTHGIDTPAGTQGTAAAAAAGEDGAR